MVSLLLLLSLASPAPVQRTVFLRHVVPSQLTQRLIDRHAQAPMTSGLTELTTDDSRRTVTLSGPEASVKTVEQVLHWLDVKTPTVEVEVVIKDGAGTPLRSKVRVPQDERGSVVLQRDDQHYRVEVNPHLNRDHTCSLAVAVTLERERREHPGRVVSGISGFQRVAPGRAITLGIGALAGNASPTVEVQLIPRLSR